MHLYIYMKRKNLLLSIFSSIEKVMITYEMTQA